MDATFVEIMMDDFDLKCLPTNFVGTSRPSKVVEALNEKREKAEKKVLQDLRVNQQKICDKYEKLLEEQSDELKRQLHDIRGLIKNELFDIKEKSNHDNANFLEKVQFKHVCKRIHEYTQRQHDLVEVFYLNLIKLEKDKSKEIADVLKQTYEDIKQISFKLPSEYDELIEFEIENVNQTILCNNRNFLELKVQLQADIQKYAKTSIFEIQKVKESWVRFVRSQTDKNLHHLKKQYTPEMTKLAEQLTGKTQELNKNMSKVDTVTQIQESELWLSNLRQTLAILDQKAQKIIMNYKQAAVIIYNRFFQELKNIDEAMVELQNIEPIPKGQAETYTPTLEEIADTYNGELERIQTAWNDLVDHLSKTVDNTYRFLATGATLWQKHFKRTEVLEVVILKDIENTIKLHNALSESYETKLNVLIDALRQEPSKERLKKTLDDVKKLLASVEALYRSQYQTEVAIMKKYKTTQELKTDVLMAEVKRFLAVYPPDLEKDPKIQRKRASQTSDITNPTDGLIPVQMLYCKFQIDAISNWQFGVWEAIGNYTAVARTEISAETDKWIQGHLTHLDRRLSIRLGMHALRMEKIEAYIYEERLEELCVHQTRFDEHKGAVERQLAKLKDEYKFYQDMFDTISTDFKNDVTKIESACIDSHDSFTVASFKPILRAKSEKCLQEIDDLTMEYLSRCETFFDRVKASDIVLIEHIKLFSEDGNFSIQETKDILKSVEKIEAQVDKVMTDVRKKVDTDKAIIEEAVNERVTQLEYAMKVIIEEHKFNEDLNKRCVKLQRELVKEVCELQSKFTALTDGFEQSKEEILENCGNYDYFKGFSEKVKYMVQKLKEMAAYLDEAVPVRLYSDKSASEMPAQMGPRKSQDLRVDEITTRLFNFEILQDQNTLFINLNKIIRTYWDDMMEFGKKFYIAHQRCFFLGDDKIHYNLFKLMKEMYKRFFHIQNQCETRSMQDTKEYLCFASNYLKFLEEYVENSADEYSRKTLKQFEHIYDAEVKKVLQETKANIKEKYKQLHQKLKSLYGHPKNKRFLEKLQIEAEIINSEAAELVADIRAPQLSKLHDEYSKVVRNYFELNSLIPEITQETQSLKAVVDNLTLKLNEKVNLLRMIVDYCPLDATGIVSHCKSFLTVYDSTSLPQLTGSTGLTKVETDSVSSLGGTPNISTKSLTKTPASTATTLATEDTDIFIASIKECYGRFAREVTGENLEEILDTLKMEWNCAVNRVVDLYAVKYDYRT